MRKKVIIILLIASAALAAPKLKIAFMGLEPSGVSESVASGVSDSFLNALINTYRFEVVERDRLEALMEEQGLAISGCTTTECFVKVGQLAGAQKVIVGKVAQVGGSYIVSVRLVDVYSSRVEQSLAQESRSLEDLLTVANSLAVQLSGTISVDGTVVLVSGNTIKTDLGSQDGVYVNDTVYLMRLGEEIYHPETGLLLGREIQDLGQATITRILADELSEAVLKGAFSVVVGDKVRLATQVGVSSVAGSTGGRITYQSGRDMNREIFVMDADGRNQTQLTNHVGNDAYPAWSPDGRRIAFNSDRDGDDFEWEIYVMDADGRNQTQLTNHCSVYAWSPIWSTDGRRIAFASDRDGDGEIFVMDTDGRNQTQLTNNSSNDSNPAWSPDGRRIAFHSNRDGDSEIFVMDADGRNQTQLTNNRSSDRYPAWSPDGRRIAFFSERDGYLEIFVMDADGRNQ
ncbi:MAG: DUF5050 domain-containing protein, partial [bacterium]|nr:DUF5050 domain-containing protein [bacterium]